MGNGPKDFYLLLQPNTIALVILDHQDDFLADLSPSVRNSLAGNTLALAKVAKICDVPVLLSSFATEAFRGQTWVQLLELFPKTVELRRSHINCWDDSEFVTVIKELRKSRLLLAGLWTETGVTFAALSALELGYEVFLVTDATASIDADSHDMAIQRMIQAGVVPVTWRQVLFESYRAGGGDEGAVGKALMEVAREKGYFLEIPSGDDSLAN